MICPHCHKPVKAGGRPRKLLKVERELARYLVVASGWKLEAVALKFKVSAATIRRIAREGEA